MTDKDTILLADFENKTGDAVFDGTLRQGLAVQLQQSPFLSLFPDERIRATLRLMNKSPDERVTRDVGREIALRQGVRAVLAGTIVNLGRNYSLTLEALNSQSGEAIALVQTEAEGKEQVLKALSQAATQMREKLGESLSSVQKFDAPLELTTSSLEALKSYSLGFEQTNKGKYLDAIPFYKHSVDLDQNFAYAYGALAVQYNNAGQPKLAAEFAEKAFALRDRVSEIERLRISLFYYYSVTGDLNKATEILEVHKLTYPRDWRATLNLSAVSILLGHYEKAIEVARESITLNPNGASAHRNMGEALLYLNRYAEAKELLERAVQQKLEHMGIHFLLYQIAFINNDPSAMQQQFDWAKGKLDEYRASDWQTGVAAFSGQWKKAQDFSRHSIDLALRNDAKEVAAQYAAEQVLRASVIGQSAPARTAAASLPALARNKVTLTIAALALALSGDASEVRLQVDELSNQYPQDTRINSIWLPTINAALELQRGNAQAAVTMLEVAKRYEPAAEFWPQYVRGLAYLKLTQAPAAAAEFQKIIDHRGEAPLSVLWPLAHLGLARAAVLQGDAAKAKQMYDEFFRLWKDADADLPVLIEAKKEYG